MLLLELKTKNQSCICQEQCTYRSGGCGRACAGARVLVNAWSLNRLHADRVSLCMEPKQLSIKVPCSAAPTAGRSCVVAG